ncbi:ATP-dependent DNA helicase [Gehongia tenuis]|uniref:ATP-dependent DNA helicase n=1 Tax=Gehongia tenuis TaxID=2763655 RepID=A0A926D4Q4_9FIRM|nr:ATP-dependent DNA helicase [Gehongia tenuis]MBC8530310.1 ATP-dependent DNA helicase [Gehongia tenuis]
MKTVYTLSVHQFIDMHFKDADLGYAFSSVSRMLEGSESHRKVQESRGGDYEAEKTLRYEMDGGDFSVVVQGRADGLFEKGGLPFVEEIKTTYRREVTGGLPLHLRQAECYAFMLAQRDGLTAVGTRLTYVTLPEGAARSFESLHTRKSLEEKFMPLVSATLELYGSRYRHEKLLSSTAGGLHFPFPSFRKGQREMAGAVWRALTNRERLMVEAPTGIGKTLAALYPAVLALGRGEIRRVFYLTARNTGHESARQALELLRQRGLSIHSLELTAKTKLCPTHGECAKCPYAKGYYSKARQILREVAGEARHWTGEDLIALGEAREVCPFELALDLSEEMDAVILDYNYAFDPRVQLKRYFAEGPRDYALILDEAHNLVDRSRDMYSAEIEKSLYLQAKGEVRALGEDGAFILGPIRRLQELFLTLRKSHRGAFHTLSELPEGFSAALAQFAAACDDFLKAHAQLRLPALLDAYYASAAFLRVYQDFSPSYALVLERDKGGERLALLCLDPSAFLQKAVSRARSAVAFSATLSPMDYYRDLLGMEGCRTLAVDSPFDPANFLPLTLPLETTWKKRDKTAPEVALALHAMVSSHPGHYLAFFPSYGYLKTVQEALQSLAEYPIIQQARDMTARARASFLKRFDGDADTLLGLAVMGGVFGEGIDLVGERLIGVAVVSVGLPQIGPRRDLIKKYFDETRGSGFNYAYVYPGMGKVLQAAGRVIRTHEDRGVALLIDQRFSRQPYRGLFPGHLQPEAVRTYGELMDRFKKFWENS